jgi:sulfite reductase (ferredoxin)
LPDWNYFDFLGWHDQGDGKLFYGISIANGRVKDEGDFKLKTALREIVQTFNLPMLLTPSQNTILYDIDPANQGAIEQILKRCGIKTVEEIDPLERYAMACPALPTCGLATAESERAIPSILERIRALLVKVGLPNESFIVRMTGCPNGCARPYLAELGFVGNGPNTYQIWLGAEPSQTRLSQIFIEKLHIDDLETTFEPIFTFFNQSRLAQESFGDFCNRVGFEALRNFEVAYEPILEPVDGSAPSVEPVEIADSPATTIAANPKVRRRLTVREHTYEQLQAAALRHGKTASVLANEAIQAYLKTLD